MVKKIESKFHNSPSVSPRVSSETARQFTARCGNVMSRLTLVAIGITGNRSDAEDIVQQAIAIAIEKNSEFESESHFAGWLVGVVRNCAINYQRKFARRRTHPTDPGELSAVEKTTPIVSPVDPSTGELNPLQRSFDDRMQIALQEIAPNARSCLLLRTVEGLSYKEISKLMEIPEGTAMNLVHRSKKKLRELLANEEGSDQSRLGDAQ